MPPTDEETCCSRTTGISDQVLLEIVSKRRLFGNRSDGYFENSWTNFRLPKIIIRFIIFFLLFLCTVNYTKYWHHLILNQNIKVMNHDFFLFFFSNKFLNVFLSFNHLYFNSTNSYKANVHWQGFFFFLFFFPFSCASWCRQGSASKILKEKSLERRNISREIWEVRQSAFTLIERNWCLSCQRNCHSHEII